MSTPGRTPGAMALAERRSTWVALTAFAVTAGLVIGLVTQPGRNHPPAAGHRPAAAKPGPEAEHGFRVIVPSIGADAPVIPEGAGGGALDVPASVHVVGWWDGVYRSPFGTRVHEKVAAPGQDGVALLAGHVDSATQGKGVFYRLGKIQPGADITVIDQNDKVTHWMVTYTQVVLKSALPANLFVDTGGPQLALVSCGGPFDSTTGHYLDNIIAWAVPAGLGRPIAKSAILSGALTRRVSPGDDPRTPDARADGTDRRRPSRAFTASARVPGVWACSPSPPGVCSCSWWLPVFPPRPRARAPRPAPAGRTWWV